MGSTPKMDWTIGDLLTVRKAFNQHCEFTFGGALKRKSEEENCNYLMIWIGHKSRDTYTVGGNLLQKKRRSSTHIMQSTKSM